MKLSTRTRGPRHRRLNVKQRRTVTASATSVAAATALLVTVLGSGQAEAVTGYHTSAPSVRVRAAATTQSAQINTVVATGTSIDIACQVAGESVTASGFGTSAVWDRLSGYNGYVSDLFIRETPYAQFDARIPRCETTGIPVPAPPAASTREAKALTWARGQLGRTTDDWGRITSGWCARWSVGAYGRMNSGYSTAYTMFKAFEAQGLTRTGVAPAGTFVFFAPGPVNGYAGHVAIADGTGGMITSTGTTTRIGPIQQRPLSYAGAAYLGWSFAPTGWTR